MPNQKKFTSEQLDAIEAREPVIVVSAGAGSGKTTVLCERIKRLHVDEHIPLDKILVITFTVASSLDMKAKLSAMDGIDAKELENMFIGTFDAFFLDFVKRFGYLIGVDNNLSIIDDVVYKNIILSSTIKLLNDIDANSHDSALSDFCARYCEGNINNFITNLVNVYLTITSFHPFSALCDTNRKAMSEELKQKHHQAFDEYHRVLADDLKSKIIHIDNLLNHCNINVNIKSQLKELLKLTRDDFLTALRNNVISINDGFKVVTNFYKAQKDIIYKYRGLKKSKSEETITDSQFQDAVNILLKIRNCFDPQLKKMFDQLIEENSDFEPKTFDKKKFTSSLTKALENPWNECKEILSILEFTHNDKNNLKQRFKTVFERDTQLLFELLCDIDQSVEKQKLELNRFTYVDVVDMVRRILDLVNDQHIVNQGVEEVRNFCENFDEVMIDEFQDTNEAQKAVIDRILDIGNGRLFVVGDVKQSIYRFRNADPTLMINLIEEINDHDGQLIQLNTNFRSEKNVIEGINTIFERLMTVDRGEVEYQKGHQLEAFNENSTTDCGVFGYKYDKDEIKLLFNGLTDKELPNQQDIVESYLILSDIKHRLETSNSENDHDQCNPNDFCVLTPKKSCLLVLNKMAQKMNIKISTQQEVKINEHPVWEVICDIMSLMCNHDVDLHLYNLLHSFLYQIDDNKLHRLFYNKHDVYHDNKVSPIKNKIDALNEALIKFGPKFVIELIFNEFPFAQQLPTIAVEHEIHNTMSKIKELLIAMIDHGYSISDVLKAITELETFELLKLVCDPPLCKDKDYVQAMTIHKSKGLEFKTLYLMGMGSKVNVGGTGCFNYSTDYGLAFDIRLALTDDDLGTENLETINYDCDIQQPITNTLGMESNGLGIIKVKTPSNELYANIKKNNEAHELIRQYYVALTRAKQRFILFTIDNPSTDCRCRVINDECFDLFDPYKPFYDQQLSTIVDNANKTWFKSSCSVKKEERNYTVNEHAHSMSFVAHERASRRDQTILDQNARNHIKKGDFLHRVLSNIDFVNPQIPHGLNDEYKTIILSLLSNELFQNVLESYTEVEFQDDQQHIKGSIDLILRKADGYHIIDYKLNNIDKDEYKKQLTMYYNYLSRVVDEPIMCHLYALEQHYTKQIEPYK